DAAAAREHFVQVAVARVVVFARAREALLAEQEAVEPFDARAAGQRAREPLARALPEPVERVAHRAEVESGIFLGGDQDRTELEIGRAEIRVAAAREIGESLSDVARGRRRHR